MPANEMLTYQQAASLLGIPIGTLYAWVSRGKVAYVRLGPRMVRFPKSRLEQLIESSLVEERGLDGKEMRHGSR